MNRKIQNSSAVSSGIFFTGSIDQSITENTNNLNIVTVDNFVLIRLTSTGNFSLTGLVPPDITLGWWLIVYNVGTNNIAIKNNDAGSSANNRFLLGTDKTLQANEGIALVYDTVSLRWRSFGINI
jgi:hypothetical protein